MSFPEEGPGGAFITISFKRCSQIPSLFLLSRRSSRGAVRVCLMFVQTAGRPFELLIYLIDKLFNPVLSITMQRPRPHTHTTTCTSAALRATCPRWLREAANFSLFFERLMTRLRSAADKYSSMVCGGWGGRERCAGKVRSGPIGQQPPQR